ncbi:hypothetical protein BGZ98_006141 [Dissophora globulifera]|nr:hypothetical protein BGZ98_006141 [Dissophora globulifera]
MDQTGPGDREQATAAATPDLDAPLHNQEQEQQEEEEYDRYSQNPDLLGETKAKATRLFSFDWASGFVSPFRPTPQDILANLFQHVDFVHADDGDTSNNASSLLDLGCGDGLVLIQALKTFPRSQLSRAVGVDLDRDLLETARTRLVQNDDDTDAILPRLELYHGDLTTKDDPLAPVLVPTSGQQDTPTTSVSMRRLLDECSHLFVYLLPEALTKLAPLLLEALEQHHKVVLSMRWEIPELSHYLIQGGAEDGFYIYKLVEP